MNITELPVFYINLDEHVEKRESTEAVLASMGFTDVTRVAGVPHKNSRLGCTMAHAEALRVALNGSHGPFLIVEDDIKVKNPNVIVDVPDSADALYLGISRWGIYNGTGHRRISVEQYSPELFRLYNMLSAHAIVYFNRDYARMLLKAYDFYFVTNDVQDKANAELMKYFEVYGLRDPIFFQEGINEKETKFVLPGDNSVNKFGAMILK